MFLLLAALKHDEGPADKNRFHCAFRTTLKRDSLPDIEILQPINLELLVTRNLAASWFSKIPGVQVQGVLRSLNVGLSCFPEPGFRLCRVRLKPLCIHQMSLGEEDLGVLMKILVENIGEGNKEHSMDVKRQVAQGDSLSQHMMGNEISWRKVIFSL